MKKFLVLLASLALAMPLVGCGGGSTEPKKTDAPTTGGEVTEKVDGSVAVFYYNYADAYISTVRSALDAEFKAAGVTFENYDGAGNQTTQNEQVDTALSKGATLLVVNVVDSASIDAAQNIATKAKDAGVPVIFFNREVDDSVINGYDKALFIGTDAAEAGHLQGKMIGEYLLKHYDDVDLNGDGSISYVMFKGQEGNNEAIYRTQYGQEDCDAELEAAGKPALVFYDPSNTDKYLVDLQGNWSAQAANEYMTTALASYNEQSDNMIELVIANNDEMAIGAIEALKAAGYNDGQGKLIPVFGVDATDSAKDLINKGLMTGTIKQDAEAMAKAICATSKNGLSGAGLLDGTDYNVDDTAAKVRIPYALYTGE